MVSYPDVLVTGGNYRWYTSSFRNRGSGSDHSIEKGDGFGCGDGFGFSDGSGTGDGVGPGFARGGVGWGRYPQFLLVK